MKYACVGKIVHNLSEKKNNALSLSYNVRTGNDLNKPMTFCSMFYNCQSCHDYYKYNT